MSVLNVIESLTGKQQLELLWQKIFLILHHSPSFHYLLVSSINIINIRKTGNQTPPLTLKSRRNCMLFDKRS